MSTALAAPAATERRTMSAPARELRVASDGLSISGYAAVFASVSEDIGFRETLAPGCFRSALGRQGADPLLLWSHDSSTPLARVSAGNLTLREDAKGLHFTATMADTTAARDAAALVRAGVVKGCSFGFTVARDRWSEGGGGEMRREVLEVGELVEISLVASPAYTATSVAARARARALVAEMRRRPLSSAGGTRGQEPYGEHSRHSYFADLAAVALADAGRQLRETAGVRAFAPVTLTGRGLVPHNIGQARARITAAAERRDVTTSDPGAQAFVPTGGPAHIARTVALAVRARGVMTNVLPLELLPEHGLTIETPRITTGASVAVQAADNSALSETDIDTTPLSARVATLAGMVDMSLQALERGGVGYEMDQVIAAELGRALAERVDVQVLSGSGASGQFLGLLNVGGITSVAYADASPTAQELWAKLMEARSTASTALGYPLDTIVMHPRRWSWIRSQRDTAGQPFRPNLTELQVVEANAVPTTLGAGTEDAILLLGSEELPILTGPPSVMAMPSILADRLTMRFVISQYGAMLAHRRPEAIAVVSGSGLISPVFA